MSIGTAFNAQIGQWAGKALGTVEAVFKQSTRDVVAEMQTPLSAGGRMRVRTGFLRASLMASTAGMPGIDPAARPAAGQGYATDFAQLNAAIDAAAIGDTLRFGYTAAYAGHREYGAGGQPPDGFVRMAAQNWPAIVARTAKAVADAG
jgi:hypothetical protein